MPLDPTAWAQAAGAIKATIDSAKTVYGLVKDYSRSKGDEPKQKEIEREIESAIATANSSAVIADIEVKKALGYRLCYCNYPPTAMLTVGYYSRNVGFAREGDQVFECPKCGLSTAGPYMFTRIVPPRHP
jgi:hypothetical protein